ncbi:MAG: glycosyltransferase family 2 protein [Cyclobacteriaceae bacterium]
MSKFTLLLGKILPKAFEEKLRFLRDSNRKYKIEKLPNEIFSCNRLRKVSFCITCMNRLFQLKQTLRKNILSNKNYPHIEFVLVDYNSNDGLDKYIKKFYQDELSSGILKYYRTDEPIFYHSSISKNLAHRIAEGYILCNLDADNFTGDHFAYYLNYLFEEKGDNNIYRFRKAPFWGTEGRICLSRSLFFALGGYDEELYPVGHQDLDLINRAAALGYETINIPIENFLGFVSNSQKEKVKNINSDGKDWLYYNKKNIEISESNILAGRLIANPKGFKNYKLYKNFSSTIVDF